VPESGFDSRDFGGFVAAALPALPGSVHYFVRSRPRSGPNRGRGDVGSPAYASLVSRAAAIPTGTVTLLFTDVEGSTRLWETEPDNMAQALRRHDELLRAAIGQAGGYVFKTVGDAFCAAFATPQAALEGALAAQRAITAEQWPTRRPIRVRMSLHTGVCEERDNDYFGPVVNRTARLEALAHGGQVLVSGATAELLSESLPEGVTLRDLGLHRLKDLGRPERVFQLEAGFLQPNFPALASLDNPELPNNLPGQLSAFVGREPELIQVHSLVASARLVTLTGSGGCGKTRLALQVAAELLGTASDGVWFVGLASLTEAERIPEAVAIALGFADQVGQQPLLEPLIDALRDQDTLILLDNCEHVIDGAAKFCGQLVSECPRLRILATSREPLGIDGEHVYRVPSLSLPPGEAEGVDAIVASDAVRLFVDRAQAQGPGFVLDEASAPLVASVCRRLDGIPLALELAAARLSSMSLQQVSDRLDQRFRLLTGGSRNAMPRQQTLQATVDWSFGLLTEPERDVLRRLSVFASGFELEGAEMICAADSVDAFDVLDLLGSLVSKSLVIAERNPDSVRYRMLETIRQYAAEALLRSGGEDEVVASRDRHAGYFMRLAEEAAPALAGPGQGRWLRRLDLEWKNLDSAASHLAAEGRTDDVLALGAWLQRFAVSRGHCEVLTWLRQAAEPADSAVPERPEAPADSAPSILANALIAIGWMSGALLRLDADAQAVAERCSQRGLAMARELGDRRLEARALLALAGVAHFHRDLDRVRLLGQEGVTIAREIGDVHLLGELLDCLCADGPSEEIRRYRLEALDCFRQTGDDMQAATEMHMMYGLDVHQGLLDEARAEITEAIATAEKLGASNFLYYMRTDFSILLLIEGKHEEAAALIRRCLLAARRFGQHLDVSELLFGAACAAAWEGDYPRAARLHGAADTDMSTSLEVGAISWAGPEQQLREQEQSRLREQMGDQAFDAARRSGAGLSRSQAMELALGRAAPS
jgi:predicted ATPase/class 3 adenylate cyclase